MKTLANCKPREFIRQTARIRHAVEKWLTLTDIANIRKRLPEYPEGASKAEKGKLLEEQARRNVDAILDAIMDEHPDETIELLGMMCFVEPEHIDDHTVSEYLGALSDMIEDKEVLRFFTSFMKLGRMSGLTG